MLYKERALLEREKLVCDFKLSNCIKKFKQISNPFKGNILRNFDDN